MKVRVNIERILVDGAAASGAQQAEFRAALTAELARLMKSNVVELGLHSTKDGVVEDRARSHAGLSKPVGSQVARHVHQAIASRGRTST